VHNTVTFDSENQSEIGGNFLWLRKVNVTCELWETGSESDRFVGSHDGYHRLDDSVVHCREILLKKADQRVVVTDTLDCAGHHRAEYRWHFSEACEVWLEGKVLYTRRGVIAVSLRLVDPALKFETHNGEDDLPCG